MTNYCKKIEDVIIPIKGTGKYLEVRSLGFPLNPTNVSFYYAIHAETSMDLNGEVTVMPGQIILEGNLIMDAETYAAWGTDDDYVWDWAAEQLNVTFLAEEAPAAAEGSNG